VPEPTKYERLVEDLTSIAGGAGHDPKDLRGIGEAVARKLDAFDVLVPGPGEVAWMAEPAADDELACIASALTMLSRLPRDAQDRVITYLSHRVSSGTLPNTDGPPF
jgi:hypothetical protein